jgi:hypothetical protein
MMLFSAITALSQGGKYSAVLFHGERMIPTIADACPGTVQSTASMKHTVDPPRPEDIGHLYLQPIDRCCFPPSFS